LNWNVKGLLFADYVRMIRNQKGVDWSALLTAEDLAYLTSRVDPNDWYPMATFERIGVAILREVARADLDAVRMWGRLSVPALRVAQPMLLAAGDPVETLMRFRVLRSTYFDFEALQIPTLTDEHARVAIRFHMGATAEEAASFQTMGFFEGLLEAAGATDVHARFAQRAWADASPTLLDLDWHLG
jgi:hypothetical protein